MRFASISLLLACTTAACSGSTPTDAGMDAVPDEVDALELETDVVTDVVDDLAVDVPTDVQPAALPGRWRLVGFGSVSAGGSAIDLTDVDQRVMFAGANTYARVNGTMSLAADRMATSFGLAVGGHVYDFPDVGSADAMAVFGAAVNGTLGDASFTPSGGSPIAFTTRADGSITMRTALPTFGLTTLTWQRIDAFPAVTGLAMQSQIVRLQSTTAAPLAHPRAALAWDRPGSGAGYVITGDAALVFIGNAPTAGYTVTVNYVLPEFTADFAGTTLSIAHLFVYDDVNQNGRFDPSTASGGDVDAGMTGDGGTMVDGDPVRGVSRVVVTVRSIPDPSAAFLASDFRDVPPGVQLGVLRDDATSPAGHSIGPFDPTTRFPIDGVIETSGTAIPDLL